MNDMFVFFFTVIASTEGFLLSLAVMLAVLLYKRNYKTASALVVSAAGLIVIVNVLKETLQVPRPDTTLIETTGYAFPSGHAAGSLFLALVISFLCRKLTKPARYAVTFLALAFALTVGWSRTVLMVHTPLQVAAGFAIGLIFALLYIWLSTKGSR